MRKVRALLVRLAGLVPRRTPDREVEAELKSHIDLHVADLMQKGIPEDEARRRALAALGGIEPTKERHRDVRGFRAVDELGRDLRDAVRGLVRNPSFAVATILTLALGIGVNAAIFAVAYGVLLRPLPYAEASRLVVFNLYFSDGGDLGFSPAQVPRWLARLQSVERAAAYTSRPLTIRTGDVSAVTTTAIVTDGFFDVLGVQARYGRAVDAEPTSVVVSSRGLGELMPVPGGQALGMRMSVSNRPYSIAAVMPPDFAFPAEETRAWIPAPPLGADSRSEDTGYFRIVGRLKPGVTVAAAEEEASRLVREDKLNRTYATVTLVGEQAAREARPVLRVSLAAGALVLLVACANVATLFLGRAATRRREVAARIALGASPLQLARSLFAETMLIAAAAAAIGVVLAVAALRLYASEAAGVLPGMDPAAAITIDGPILVGIALVTILAAFVSGALPAWQAARSDVRPMLRGRGVLTPGSWRIRGALVAIQIALSVVLLIGAGLLTRSVQRLLSDDPGFVPAGALAARIVLSDRVLFDGAGRETFVKQLLERVRALPGVEHAGIGSNLPPRNPPITIAIRFINKDEGVDELHFMKAGSSTPGHVRALGVRFVRGRDFVESDGASGEAVILSESIARLFFRDGSDPIGRTITSLPRILQSPGRPVVVGVVSDVKYEGLDVPPGGAVYLPWTRRPVGTVYLVVRTAGDPMALAPAIRAAIAELDPSIPVSEVRTLDDVMAESISGERLRMFPAVGFGMLALLVTLMGLLATLSHAVGERRQELAIRSVLGSSPSGLVRTIMVKGIVFMLLGVAGGLALASVVGHSLAHLLFRTSPYDSTTFIGVAALVTVGAVLAMYAAARKAATTDPLATLRGD